MTLAPGTRLGPYEIVAALGAGGMGEVYRARDTELGRDVAIKVLPPALAENADRLIRFRREAQLLASLNHPNIGSIYGLAEGDGARGLVLELVEGDTLADVIAHSVGGSRSGLDVGRAVNIARQIAEALDAAHQRGIIHRDLKPANIKITPAGLVKLLDFGLGKDLASNPANAASLAATAAPAVDVSFAGMILGTVGYMSPEQVRAEPLDSRTDLFSLGVLLYEMTTGRPPFEGTVTTVVFDAILHATPPPPSRLNPSVPAALDRMILALLEKNRDARYATASEVVGALRQIEAGADRVATTRTRAAWLAGAAVTVAIASGLMLWTRPQKTLPTSSDYVQVTHVSDSAVSPSLSPDGRMLAFLRGPDTFFGPGQVYVKALPDGEPVQLTHDGLSKMSPLFSPEGSRLAYTTVDPHFGWDTWMVSVVGGEPRLWLKNASGLSWMDPRTLLFSEITDAGIHMSLVAASENRTDRRAVYEPTDHEGMTHRSSLSPDRKSVLLAEMVANVFSPCRVVPLDGSSVGRRVGPEGQCTHAAWSPDGRWMYFSAKVGGAFHIWRQRTVEGRPEQLTSGPSEEEGLAIAPDGRSLLTSLGTTQAAVWVHDARGDREVSAEGNAFIPTLSPVMAQPFSADGRKLFYLVRQGTRSIGMDRRSGALWMTDLDTDRRTPLLPGFDVLAYDISRDGSRIAFAAFDDKGTSHLWLARLDGRLAPRQVSPNEADSPRFGAHDEIFFRMQEGADRFIFRMREDGAGIQKVVPEPVLFFMSISPDSAWVIARVQPAGHAGNAVVAFSTQGKRAVPVCLDCEADWAPGGTAFVVRAFGLSAPRSFVVALTPPGSLPRLPGVGIRAEAEAAALGFVVNKGYRYPGRDVLEYAYMKASTQRNIYRVPLP